MGVGWGVVIRCWGGSVKFTGGGGYIRGMDIPVSGAIMVLTQPFIANQQVVVTGFCKYRNCAKF